MAMRKGKRGAFKGRRGDERTNAHKERTSHESYVTSRGPPVPEWDIAKIVSLPGTRDW